MNDIELESLIRQVSEMYEPLKAETRRRWQRDLPF